VDESDDLYALKKVFDRLGEAAADFREALWGGLVHFYGYN